MRILVIKPLCKPKIQEIDGSLKAMQDIVDGTIQIIRPFDDPVVLVCNDDGIMLDLQANRSLENNDGSVSDIILGTFFLCGISQGDDGDDLTGLTDELIMKYSAVFRCPEMFFEANGQILCLELGE